VLGGIGPEENKELQVAITEMQEYIIKRIRSPLSIPLSYFNGKRVKFNKLVKKFDEWTYQIIDEARKKQHSSNNLLSMLMEAKDEETGETMSDKQLRDELLTIYVAGHETSTYALSWTLYLLAKHPEVYAKAKAEVNNIDDISNIGFKAVYGLPYLNQVLNESMRIFPPAYIFGRRVAADIEIDSTQLLADDNVIVNVYALHRDPNIWKNPNEFDPERFTKEAVKKRDKYAFIPFGGGPRMCIGNNFAIMEIIMLLAKLLYHFDLELMNEKSIQPEPLITLRPNVPILMKLK